MKSSHPRKKSHPGQSSPGNCSIDSVSSVLFFVTCDLFNYYLIGIHDESLLHVSASVQPCHFLGMEAFCYTCISDAH